MQDSPKITVYTQTYNAGNYLRQSIESVLNQTYTDFEYIIADHGSTDSTCEIIEEYRLKDKRIRSVRFDHNAKWLITKIRYEFMGEFYTVLDQDDWIESDYIERLLNISKKTGADIVNTGSVFFNGSDNEFSRIIQANALIIDNENYDKFFPVYHWYYRQYWGKLIKTELLKKASFPEWHELGLIYGIDTYTSFTLLKYAKRICIDNSALHHYRLHLNSVSHKYTENRSYSDLQLYNYSVDFLSKYGDISKENRLFLYLVYLNALNDTLKVLFSSSLSKKEKCIEVIEILNRTVTRDVLLCCRNKSFFSDVVGYDDYLKNYRELSSKVLDELFGYIFISWTEDICPFSDIEDVFEKYFSEYSKIICIDSFSLWGINEQLRTTFLSNNTIELICEFADLIHQNKYTKKYDLETIVKTLSEKDSILTMITDKRFIKNYYDVYIAVAKKEYMNALDKMTEMISSDHKKINGSFIDFYLTLSALLEKTDEFVNGKLVAAKYYIMHNQYEQCRAAINDLEEMGFGDDEQIIEINNLLNNME